MAKSWTLPLDRRGLVIYFGINGREFLYNGNTGSFYDSLPAHTVEILNGFLLPKKEQAVALRALRAKHGAGYDSLLHMVEMYRAGSHPDLLPEPRMRSFRRPPSPNIFNVYASQACNLACRYCINQQGTFGKSGSVMSPETATQVVGFISQHVRSGNSPIVTVILFGGEPLLARKAVRTLARGLQDLNRAKLPTKVHLVLVTNGTIYAKEIFDILAEQPECNTVAVSLDAFQETHDRNRPFADPAKGSGYDTVVANLRRMTSEGIPTSVTCVVPYPYNYVAACEELHRLGIRRLEIKPLINHVFGTSELPDTFKEDFELWKQNYLAYTDYYLDYLRTPDPAKHVDRFAVFHDCADALSNRREHDSTLFCGVAELKIGIASDGRLLPCECFLGQRQFDLGNASSGFRQASYESFEQWILAKGQLRIDSRRCRNCYAKLACGGCYAVSYDESGDLRPLSPSCCRHARERLKIDLYYIARMRKEHPQLVPNHADGGS